MSKSIAIIGAGPSGCALACFLAEKGWRCVVFDDGRKPSLLVGESLIPAAMPIIRRLGIEDQVAEISAIKKGAALSHGCFDARVDFEFQNLGEKKAPCYAYNIPRPQFDAILINRAKELGVKIINKKATINLSSASNAELELSQDSLCDAGFKPDLLVDSTGRARLFSKTLGIKSTKGARNDVAHFAHFENYPVESAVEGQIVITVLECGWSWQIPLKGSNSGKTSVGVVLNAKSAKQYGQSAQERLSNIIAANPALQRSKATQISDVQTYANYQLLSEKAHGPGWALVGDALGFVDPMLSPGVFMALESAQQLDIALTSTRNSLDFRLKKYYSEMTKWHQSWTTLIQYFYDGRLLRLGEMRTNILTNSARYSFGRIAEWFVSKSLAQLISGAGTRSRRYQNALAHTCAHLLKEDELVKQYAVKNNLDSQLRIGQSENELVLAQQANLDPGNLDSERQKRTIAA